jgi:hypothetical protein
LTTLLAITLQDVVPAKMAGVSVKFGKRLKIDASTARDVLDPGRFVDAISTEGGSNRVGPSP